MEKSLLEIHAVEQIARPGQNRKAFMSTVTDSNAWVRPWRAPHVAPTGETRVAPTVAPGEVIMVAGVISGHINDTFLLHHLREPLT